MTSTDGLSTLTRCFFRAAASGACIVLVLGCSSVQSPSQQWAAFGYLSPGKTGKAEVIGVFDNKTDCDAAAEGWMSRQVVGNPVFAECGEWDDVNPPRVDKSGLLIVPG